VSFAIAASVAGFYNLFARVSPGAET